MTATMNSERKVSVMAYSEIIESCIGSFHRWQLMVFLIVFLVNAPLAMQELSITMIAAPADFKCSNPAFNSCVSECPSHTFDKSIFKNTIIMEWNLICDDYWLENFSQTILMAGIFFGNLIFGFFSDRYGRRKPLVAAIIMEIVTGIGIAFCQEFWLFLFLRFLVAVAAGGTLCTGFVLVVEVIGRKYRSTFGILFQMTYYFGHAMLGLIGYLIRDWRYIQLTISIPVVLLISYYWILPESPRWLLSVGRLEEAVIVLEKAARFNRMPAENIRDMVMSKMDHAVHKENFCDLFTHENVRKKTILIWFNWTAIGLAFFGVAQYISRIAGDNIFINTALAGAIQIPGNFFLIYAIQKWGRKLCIITTYTICSVALLLIIVVPAKPEWIITVLGCIGMMGISLSFATLFVWSGELFPTPVRNIGMGTSATCAKIGSMVAPFISSTDIYLYWVPPAIFGVAPLLGILVSIFLPETLDTKMPDSIGEAEMFGKKIISPRL